MTNYVRVSPLTSARTGDAVKNQYVVNMPGQIAFQSYDSLIAVYDLDLSTLTIGRDWDYSMTTVKYLRQFIDGYAFSIRAKLPTGKSYGDTIRKAIEAGLIQYDENMR